MTATAALQRTLHDEIPLTRAMDVRVAAYDGKLLRLTAPLPPNVNDKGTAFGGSLYTLAVLCGWSLLRLKVKEAGLQYNIVIQEANVRYLLPVSQDLTAECSIDNEAVIHLYATLNTRGRARVPLEVVIKQNERPAFEFSGRYVVLK